MQGCTCVSAMLCSVSCFLLDDIKKKFTSDFSIFSKPLRLLYSLIIYLILNFLSSLFTLCYFFLYLKSVLYM